MNKEAPNLLRNDAEPTVGNASLFLPMWLVGLLGFLIFWSCNTLDQEGGKFSSLVHQPYISTNELAGLKPGGGDELFELGKLTYKNVCAPCHQETGGGVAGQFPPLVGSEWVTAEGPNRLIRLVQTGLSGPIKVKGTDWNLVMPPMGAALDDKQLAAVLHYIRNSWGNKASKVTPDQVKKVRADLGGRTDPHTGDELMKLPETP